MKIVKLLLCLITVFLFYSCGEKKVNDANVTGFSVKDDLNNQLYFNTVPSRVISLAPNLTEMVFSLGIEDKLVGNTLYCLYPEAAKKKEKVGDLLTIDFEKVLSLKPDLILITVEGNTKDSYEKLKNLGLKIFVSNPRDFKGIKNTYSDLGKIFKVENKAEKTINDWNTSFDSIVKRKEQYPREKAMFLVSLNPLMLAGKSTFINELMTSAGLYNIASTSPMNYPVFNREEILKYNPDYIVLENRFLNDIKNLEKAYPEWKSINAVKNGRIIFFESDLYLAPGPRFITALEDLFSKLHPQGR